MKSVTLLTGSIGVDTIIVLNKAMCEALRREGVRFVVRYLGGLKKEEQGTILESGLGLSYVTYAHVYDGHNTVSQLQSLGVPVGTVVWQDCENVKMDAASLIANLSGWGHIVKDAGYIPGLYAGAGALLTSEELYKLPHSRYWHSCSRVTDRDGHEAAPSCGWAMYQLHPPNLKLAGVKVDINAAQLDYRGRGVSVVVAS